MINTIEEEMENERYDKGVNCCDISVIYLEDVYINPTDEMIEWWDKNWNGVEVEELMGEKHYEMMKQVITKQFM